MWNITVRPGTTFTGRTAGRTAHAGGAAVLTAGLLTAAGGTAAAAETARAPDLTSDRRSTSRRESEGGY